uniref:Uncharacterized protein n=2 Tax=Anguilla anguilla TaxID=7936 RepID=A0A0E9VX96_ANGAN
MPMMYFIFHRDRKQTLEYVNKP